MKKIMSACLITCLTEGEYQWIESTEEDYGRCWNGDVRAYLVSSAADEEAMEAMISRDYHGAIHNLPQDAIILVDEDGTPRWIYWAEDASPSASLSSPAPGPERMRPLACRRPSSWKK